MQNTPDWRSAPRNVFSTEFKLRMVELAQLPGANIAAIARERLSIRQEKAVPLLNAPEG